MQGFCVIGALILVAASVIIMLIVERAIQPNDNEDAE